MREAGFGGFKSIEVLRQSELREVPKARGVYFVLRPDWKPPLFSDQSTGCWRKRKDPTEKAEELQARWIESSPVLYIGKAGGTDCKAILHGRLKSYFRFGLGKNSGRAGGRRIWQLANSAKLIVCWKVTPLDEPCTVESELLETFCKQYGRLPFANGRR